MTSVHLRVTFACVMVCAVATFAAAETITLEFTSLPSAQGWTYVASGNSAAESSIFSVDGTTLHQNSIGVGMAASGSNRYNYNDIVDPLAPFSIEVTARVLTEEGAATNHFGFAFGAHLGTESFAIGLGTGAVSDISGNLLLAFDTRAYHNYLLDVIPGTGWELFIDGAEVASGAPRLVSAPNQLILGDGTGGANAAADVIFYEFSQPQEVPAIPEPATLTLLGIGLLGAHVRRKLRR